MVILDPIVPCLIHLCNHVIEALAEPLLNLPLRIMIYGATARTRPGLLWTTPDGNLTRLPGMPYLTGKTVGLISTAGGIHGLQAINQMENILRPAEAIRSPSSCPCLLHVSISIGKARCET